MVRTQTSTAYGTVMRRRARARPRSSTEASRVVEIVVGHIQNADVSWPNWLYIRTPSIPAAKHAK
ncbi:hypothetical protein SALBM135S_05377 [Streptomyces alboniger]